MTCAALISLATAVAAELRMTCQPGHAEDESDAWITAGSERLYLRRYRDRIIITGAYPPTQHPAGHYSQPQITVSGTRAPAAISGEITRRLLPRYRDTLAEVLARNVADAAGTTARNTLAAEITELFEGGPGRVVARQDTSSHAVHLDTACGSGLVRIYDDAATTYLQLRSLPASVTMQMLAILAAETPREPTPS